LRQGQELSSYNFKTPYSEVSDLSTTFYQPKGFSDQLDFIKQDFIPGACGVLGGKVLLAVSKDQIIPVLDEDYVSDAGSFRNYNRLIFPAEQGGKVNTIKVLRIIETDWDDQKNAYQNRKSSVTNYTWNGENFTKAK
jgi:hypothetical protein